MDKSTKKLRSIGRDGISLAETIHEGVRHAIEYAIHEELEALLGERYRRLAGQRVGYRNGYRTRELTGPTGPLSLTVPRARLFRAEGDDEEWQSRLVPRYQRRLPEINSAIAAVYLSGGNTRRIRGALRPLLKDAPLSKSAVSRIVGTFKTEFETWRKRSLTSLPVMYLYLDGIVLRVRSGRKVVRMPVLVALGVLADGTKQLLALDLRSSESNAAWKGLLEGLVERKLRRPKLCIIDGNSGLRGGIEAVWPKMPVQRCTVHKLRNLESKAPKHAIDEIKEDYHGIVYADSLPKSENAYEAFQKKWRKLCPGVVTSLEEGGKELLTFYSFPQAQWKSLRTTNAIERLNMEFRRRVKTQGSFPTEDSAIVLLFGLVASGQVVMRKIDGHEQLRDIPLKKPMLAAA